MLYLISIFAWCSFIAGCGGGDEAQVQQHSSGKVLYSATVKWGVSRHLSDDGSRDCRSGWCTKKFSLPESIKEALISMAKSAENYYLVNNQDNLSKDVYLRSEKKPVRRGEGIEFFVELHFSKPKVDCFDIQVHFVPNSGADISSVFWLLSFKEILLQASSLKQVDESSSREVSANMIWKVSKCPGIPDSALAQITYKDEIME